MQPVLEIHAGEEIDMSDKLIGKILLGVFLVSLLSAPALQAGGTQVTLDDAIWDFYGMDQYQVYVGESVSATGDTLRCDKEVQ